MPADTFLKTGVMMAAFHFCGTAPTDISCVNAMDNTSAKRAASFLNRIGGRPSGPLDRVVLSLDITIATSSVLNSTVSSDFVQLMKSVQTGRTPLSTVPTDAKFSVNNSALALSSVTILPSLSSSAPIPVSVSGLV